MADRYAIDILWIPLGAGAHAARLSGRLYERGAAVIQRRAPCDLYHSALVAHTPEGSHVIEQTPEPAGDPADRGVVAGGAVGFLTAGGWRVFRYEVRRWLHGVIPDADHAVGGPRRLTRDPDVVRRVLAAVPYVPTPVWGRDELGTGEMWNSNSVISWVSATGGVEMNGVKPPAGGRAPGWHAGLVVAARRSAVGGSARGSR